MLASVCRLFVEEAVYTLFETDCNKLGLVFRFSFCCLFLYLLLMLKFGSVYQHIYGVFFLLLLSIVVYWVNVQNALVSQKQDKSIKTMCLPSYHQKGFIETHALGIAMSDSLFPLHGLPQNHYGDKEEVEFLSWFHMHLSLSLSLSLSLCIYIYIYIYIYI